MSAQGWDELVLAVAPSPPAVAVDLGWGTGSLSLLLAEGRWGGVGITARECRDLVLRHRERAEVRVLDDARWWGRPVDDERCCVVSTS